MVEEKITKKEVERIKEDLEDLETYIKEFSSFLPLAICTLNPVGIIIDVNKMFQNITKYTVLEIVGKELENIFLEKNDFNTLLNDTRKDFMLKNKELTLIPKEGKEVAVNVSVSVRRDNKDNFIGYFLAITDISEIKQYQKELEEKVKSRTSELEDSRSALMNMLEDVEEIRRNAEDEKNKTLAIITNFTDGLIVFDQDKKLSLINPVAEKYLNIGADRVVGKSVGELSEFLNIVPLAKVLGRDIKKVFRNELKIDKETTLEITTVPIRKEEEDIGTILIMHDITREKMVERLKTEFVSLAAHQLRTPLSAIKWTLKMFLDGDLGDLKKEQEEFIKKTYRSNERMISLINDLLDVTRIEEGRYLYKLTPTEIESVVQFLVNSSKEIGKRKNITLEFKKPVTKLPKINIDVEKIRLAIQNLIDNAIKYSSPGGKIIISLKHDKDKKEIEFQIKDNGVGIPEDQQKRMFTKFFRGSNVIRMETDGSGLGLFIVKNIIEAHDGKIWFKSQEGKGTTFYLTIPIKEEFEEFLKEF